MEWKKDSISASELERKQQEYIREAMEMLKRAKPSEENKPGKEEEKPVEANIPLPMEHVAESAEKTAESIDYISEMSEEAAESVENTSERLEENAESIDDISEAAEEAAESIDDISEAAEEVAESIDDISEMAEEIGESTEKTEEIAEEIPEEITESSQPEDTVPKEETEETGGKYGVYSAEELINGAGEDEGIKSAAEMLAELKSKTEIMRSLVEAADPSSEKQDLPKGQYVCPKCGRSSPHGRYQ